MAREDAIQFIPYFEGHLNEFTDFGGKIALIFGNEVDGISECILNDLDYCIEIPQYGTKHSLNVSVCAGIVLWTVTHSGH